MVKSEAQSIMFMWEEEYVKGMERFNAVSFKCSTKGGVCFLFYTFFLSRLSFLYFMYRMLQVNKPSDGSLPLSVNLSFDEEIVKKSSFNAMVNIINGEKFDMYHLWCDILCASYLNELVTV